MSHLKDKLIRLGSQHKDLQDDIATIVDHLTGKKANIDVINPTVDVRVRVPYKAGPMDDKYMGKNITKDILKHIGGTAHLDKWASKIQKGPDVILTEDDFYLDMHINPSSTYRMQNVGEASDPNDVAKQVAREVAQDVEKMFKDKGLEADKRSIRITKMREK
jgi:hypothetical protein